MPTEPFTQALDHSAVVSNFVFLAKTTMFQERRCARKRCEKVDISASSLLSVFDIEVSPAQHRREKGAPRPVLGRQKSRASSQRLPQHCIMTANTNSR
jgi:hypothetical protein